MMDKMPEIIWLWIHPARDNYMGIKYHANDVHTKDTEVKYLRSTPLLERAEEMRGLLQKVYRDMIFDDKNKQALDNFLATIKKAEEEREK